MLSDWCERHTEYKQVTEVARGIMNDLSITRNDLKYYLNNEKQKFFDFQQAIFEKQNSEECYLLRSGSSFIADRGPDPLVFVEQGIDSDSAMKLANTSAAKVCLERYRSKHCLIIVLCPLEEIEDDSVRLVPTAEEQLKYTEILQKLLRDLKIPFRYCDRKDRQERIDWLEKAVLDVQNS